MMRGHQVIRLPFLFAVTLCLAQIGWWVFFQYRESQRVETQERDRLQAQSFLALVSLLPRIQAAADSESARLELARALAKHYPELELAPGPGPELSGARISEVLPDAAPELAGMHVRPSATALAAILEERNRKRRMFTAEGITFSILLLIGIFLLYAAMRNEMRIRRQHESFLAGATHELKTPLASIRLGLETLAGQRVNPERADQYLQQMLGQVDRLEMELTNLLNLAGRQERSLKLSSGLLSEDLLEVAQEFKPRLETLDLELAMTVADDEQSVLRDREAIKLVIRNLIDNALKYSPKSGRIFVDLDREDGCSRLRVRDEGPGVAPEDRDHIFDRFYRGQARTTESRGGSGLGLYLARRLVLAHQGRLALVTSGGGACFELCLPCQGAREGAA